MDKRQRLKSAVILEASEPHIYLNVTYEKYGGL